MQVDAGVSRGQNDREEPGRSVDGVVAQQGSLGGAVTDGLRVPIGRVEGVEPGAGGSGVVALLAVALANRNGTHRQSHDRLRVPDQPAIAGGDDDLLYLLEEPPLHVRDRRGY